LALIFHVSQIDMMENMLEVIFREGSDVAPGFTDYAKLVNPQVKAAFTREYVR